MTAQELNAYISKVLGNSIRCLLPSYWWKRILSQIVGYVESNHELLDSKIKVVDTSLSGVTVDVSKVINIIKKTFYVTITTSPEGPAKVYADGKAIDIPADETVQVFCGDSFHAINPAGGSSSSDLENILSIDTSMIKTSWYTSMYCMFMWCRNVSSLDVSAFDTSNVVDMSNMFDDCMSLTSLDVSGFDTSKVKSMYKMFNDCMGLSSLDVSNFDTSMVMDMSTMFRSCHNLTSLNLSNFDTSIVVNMSNMFMYCYELASLDLSGFDTSNVLSMYDMFYSCSNITQLSLGEGFFKTKSVTEVDFSDLGNWAQDSFLQSVVTNSYDRTSNGLPNITIKLHANTYAYLTDEHKATLTAKGYDVVSA